MVTIQVYVVVKGEEFNISIQTDSPGQAAREMLEIIKTLQEGVKEDK